MRTETVSGAIRCVVCGGPANTLTEQEQFCLEHGLERSADEGGRGQFVLRGRILRPEPRGLGRMVRRHPPTR